jgi:hypothetical protein
MTLNPGEIGHNYPGIDGVRCKYILGHGLSTDVVFEGELANHTGANHTAVVVKVYKNCEARDNEIIILNMLEACSVPRVVMRGTTDDGRSYLCLTPVGLPCPSCHGHDPMLIMKKEHMELLMDIVQHAHEVCHIAHRDIKPSNIYFSDSTEDRRIILNDWSSAVPESEYTDAGVKSPPFTDGVTRDGLGVKNDLIAVVKSCYTMRTNDRSFPRFGGWVQALHAAENGDFQQTREHLRHVL